MILEVLEAEEPAVFHQELFNTLVHYYEEILVPPGAGGRPKPKSFKRNLKMNSAQPSAAPASAAAGGDSAEDAADGPPAPPPLVEGGGGAEPPSAGAAAAPTGPAAGKRGKGGAKA